MSKKLTTSTNDVLDTDLITLDGNTIKVGGDIDIVGKIYQGGDELKVGSKIYKHQIITSDNTYVYIFTFKNTAFTNFTTIGRNFNGGGSIIKATIRFDNLDRNIIAFSDDGKTAFYIDAVNKTLQSTTTPSLSNTQQYTITQL